MTRHPESVTQPPVIPGPEPFTLSSVLPASPPRRRQWPWLLLPLVVAIVMSGAYFLGQYLLADRGTPTAAASSSPASTPIRDAYFRCGQVGRVADQDHTIELDTQGDALTRADATEVNCVLSQLGAPEYIFRTIMQTRAIDGRQREQWKTFEASWSYHPSNGLNVIIHDAG